MGRATSGWLVRSRQAPSLSENSRTSTPEWSWHVAEFFTFAETAIELCDGTPTFTEGDAQSAGEGVRWDICYWNYTVVAEITVPVPVEPSTWGGVKALFGD